MSIAIGVLRHAGTDTSNLVKDYQTLIAGALALAAALVTVWPVWLQLSRLSVQSNTIFYDYLMLRLAEVRDRAKRVRRLVETFEGNVAAYLYEQSELYEEPVGTEWAHAQEQNASRLHLDLQGYLETPRDSPGVDVALGDFVEVLVSMEECLRAIHRPDSVSGIGEDDAPLSVEQANELKAEAGAARMELPSLSQALSKAARDIAQAFGAEIEDTQRRARLVEAQLLSAGREKWRIWRRR